jgi:hypothetical protein
MVLRPNFIPKMDGASLFEHCSGESASALQTTMDELFIFDADLTT